MKKVVSMFITVMLVGLMCCINVFASSATNQYVRVPAGSSYFPGNVNVTRTKNYSYVSVNIQSVYPDSGTDTFTKCKVKLYRADATNTAISNEYTLTEGSGYKSVYIKDGYLNLSTVGLYFAGNNPNYGANILYSYNGN